AGPPRSVLRTRANRSPAATPERDGDPTRETSNGHGRGSRATRRAGPLPASAEAGRRQDSEGADRGWFPPSEECLSSWVGPERTTAARKARGEGKERGRSQTR